MDQPGEATKDIIPPTELRYTITLGSLLLALAHLVWPTISIDAITLFLIVIAVLPWLTPLIKSLELPGDWKLDFQELQKAAFRADTAGLLAAEPTKAAESFSFQSIAKRDPNLALAGLRIEIEKRLTKLAEVSEIEQRRLMGVGQLLLWHNMKC